MPIKQFFDKTTNLFQAESIYHFIKEVEAKSPGRLAATLALSQWQSAYLNETLTLTPKNLTFGTQLTETGKHIERLLGVDPRQFERGMTFKRTKPWSAYMELQELPGYSVRFAERGRLTASSGRYGRALQEPLPLRSDGTLKGWFRKLQSSERVRGYLPRSEAVAIQYGGETKYFHPLFGRRPGLIGGVGSALDTANRIAFEAAERPLRLLSSIGVGLKPGTYNKLIHMPFAGEGGIINELLTKRVLPAYLAVTAARYINYKLNNKPAEAIASVPLKLNVLRAEITDRVPGLRATTDFYNDVVPGPQYGPLALPIGGGVLGVALGHYLPMVKGDVRYASDIARRAASHKAMLKGAIIGGILALPFLPGMIGSRQTADELRRVYSGQEDVPVRAGRWWEVGSTPFSGGRVKYYRPHWYHLMQSKAETVATYGSQDAYWEHHPLLHPFKYLKDPYWLEKQTYEDRPYPITSPAFSNVPLVGPLLAATVGRIVKPPVRMHEDDWDISQYILYSKRLEPKGPDALAPAIPREEYSFKDVIQRQAKSFAEYTGLPGFIATTLYGNYAPQGTPGKDVILQGSRQMTNLSKEYYARELGAISGFNPEGFSEMPFGYSEPLRRFIQPDNSGIEANAIPNTMPSWMPGEDYMVNFRVGDPYGKIPEGGARLPGAGYAALHPELKDLSPNEYPDIVRYKILADVAPYSKEYMIYKAKIRKQAESDTEVAIQYSRIEEQVQKMKESTVQFDQRHFTAPVERIAGTIKRTTPEGLELEEYPNRKFTFSSLGMSAADLSAIALGEQNTLTRTQVAHDVDRRRAELQNYLQGKEGSKAELVVPSGTEEHAQVAKAVIFVDDVNINKDIIDKGLASMRIDLGGSEAQAMYGGLGKLLGKYAETVSFTGEGGPLRFVPTPYHTKYWQEKTALAQYQEQEVYGSRMRRWQRPFHDMVAPWARGLYRRLTGDAVISKQASERRTLDSVVDELDYLRGYIQAAAHPGQEGRYTSQAKRTNIGGNLFGSPQFVSTTLPRREKLYFQAFLQETDPEKRQQILESVSPEMYRALSSQWIKQDAIIAKAEGREIPQYEQGGILYTEEGLKEYDQAKTDLSYSDYIRSREIAETFSRAGFEVPGPGSPLWSEDLDYEDVKLKIIQNEGYDMHDFNIYDDRAALLWRKPYVDGAVRELTGGSPQTTERIRQTVERIIIEGKDKNPSIAASTQASQIDSSSVNITVDEQGDEAIMKDIRRNPDDYRGDATS